MPVKTYFRAVSLHSFSIKWLSSVWDEINVSLAHNIALQFFNPNPVMANDDDEVNEEDDDNAEFF